ncbi:MAG: amylo-alpha-1,6-glucosidase [Acidimicrobiia bacterium]|nr:amylo-alpha-1,6-glucosidase [Acidimicrobiia bacterium]
MVQPWASSASAPISSDGGPVTLVDESTFCISGRSGDFVPGSAHGLFFRDTRFLSVLRLRVNGDHPEPLSSVAVEPFSGAFVLRDNPRPGQADSHLVVFRRRYVGQGMREDVTVRNYGTEPAYCALEIEAGADFADLFEVKEGRVVKVGDLDREATGHRLTFTYRRNNFRRAVHLDFTEEPRLDGSVAAFEVIVPPGEAWTTCLQVTLVIDDAPVSPRYRCGEPVERAAPIERLEEWRERLPTVTTDHDWFRALVGRSGDDLAALRIFDPDHPERAVVAAGAPWFMTLFGRDSLITSWMAMIIDPDLALGTLQTLARFQGEKEDPLTEEEPGRILHEMRFGETAELSLGSGNIYYGTVDATPLFVMLLGELRRWGIRPDEVDALLPAADRALEWIDTYGDRDGDGYVEYRRTSDRGLRNQGWKDSWDGVRFADGRLPETPVALCEVQGYVYAALLARSRFAEEAGDADTATRLADRAAGLKARFNRDFWLEDRGWFAMGLDADKAPIDALASNMGHCLWTGIVDADKAERVARRLLSDDMFTGWGVRTLAASMTGYNPISYHCGSVWPHDNAIVAAGLMRYGFVEETHRILEGMIDAAASFGLRLPELFAGLPRRELGFPVGYPTSCSPQAWATASPLLFLRTMLRFQPDLRRGRLTVDPVIPGWIGRLRLDGLPILDGSLSLDLEGESCAVVSAPPGLEVVCGGRPATRP